MSGNSVAPKVGDTIVVQELFYVGEVTAVVTKLLQNGDVYGLIDGIEHLIPKEFIISGSSGS